MKEMKEAVQITENFQVGERKSDGMYTRQTFRPGRQGYTFSHKDQYQLV